MERISLLFLLGFLDLVQANGAVQHKFNRGGVNSLLRRLNSLPGDLQWNFFSPNQQTYLQDRNFANKQSSRNNVAAQNLRLESRLPDPHTSILHETNFGASGNVDFMMEGQVEVPTRLLMEILQILSADKQPATHNHDAYFANGASKTGERLDNTVLPKGGINHFAGHIASNINAEPPKLLKTQSGLNQADQMTYSAEGKRAVPTNALISKIKKLLDKSKRRKNDIFRTQNMNGKPLRKPERTKPQQSNRAKPFRKRQPIILEPVQIGHISKHKTIGNNSASKVAPQFNGALFLYPSGSVMNANKNQIPFSKGLNGNGSGNFGSSATEKQLVHVISPDVWKPRFSAPGLRENNKNNGIQLTRMNFDSATNGKQVRQEAANNINVDAAGQGDMIMEGEIAIPTHLLGDKSLGLFAAPKDARKTNLNWNKQQILNRGLNEAQGLNTFMTPLRSEDTQGNIVPYDSLTSADKGMKRSTSETVDQMPTSPNTNMRNVNGNNLRPVHSGISNELQVDASGSGNAIMEGEIMVPKKLIGVFSRNFNDLIKDRKSKPSNNFGRAINLNNIKEGQYFNNRKPETQNSMNRNSFGRRLPDRVPDKLSRGTNLRRQGNRISKFPRNKVGGQGRMAQSGQSQLDLSGSGEIRVDGEVEVPTHLLKLANKFRNNPVLRETNYNKNSGHKRGVNGVRIKRLNENNINVNAHGSGDFTLEGQFEIPTAFLRGFKLANFDGFANVDVNNLHYNQRRRPRFQNTRVSQHVNCRIDSVTKGLSCDLRYLKHPCEETWNFRNPCQSHVDGIMTRRTKHAHPRDNTKYLSCMDNGKFYIVHCPEREVFHERCGYCVDERLPRSLSCSETNKLASAFIEGVVVGKVTSRYVNEASGLCASRVHKNVLYTHNDSGDTQRIFAIDATSGNTLAIINISGAQSQDWEDIACGPCVRGSGHCIYIADTGGNAGGLSNTIYRIKEPTEIRDQTVPLDSSLLFSWDQQNCETLMVDPRGQVYLISKVQGGKGKFVRLPSLAWGKRNRTHVVDGVYLNIRTKHENPTGGDISPDGREMLVKTYGNVLYWHVPDGNYYAAITKPATSLPYLRERQGESVCWDSQGYGYYTLSEGYNSSLFYYQRSGYPSPVDA